jgi:hypothetical protein
MLDPGGFQAAYKAWIKLALEAAVEAFAAQKAITSGLWKCSMAWRTRAG